MNPAFGGKSVKRFADEPIHAEYLDQWARLYDSKNYDGGLTGFFLKKSHEWCERRFSPSDHFSQVLEVGAGTGIHQRFVRHTFDDYLMTDLHPAMIDRSMTPATGSGGGRLRTATEDAAHLSFEDDRFDRVIATHVLEHLQSPHQVLREWVRVLKPGGILSIVLPCDPGIGWRLGRYAVARPKFLKAGLLYDYWMAREHVNPINNLVSFVRHYFDGPQEQWLPMRIPSIDLNLFYIVHARV